MKEKHTDTKGFGIRAILSSLFGELVDSSIFLPIVFLGVLPLNIIITMAITQVILKVSYEVIMLPITKLVVEKAKAYEEKI